jgi:hypothetical protein
MKISTLVPTGEMFVQVQAGSQIGVVFDEALAYVKYNPPFVFELNDRLFHVARNTTFAELDAQWIAFQARRDGR